MVRPIKTLSPKEAASWILQLSIKAKDSEFLKNIQLEAGEGWRERSDRHQDAKAAIEALYIKHCRPDTPGDDAHADLRSWIDTYLAPEGWLRIQAAERQRKHSRRAGSDDQLTKMTSLGGLYFSDLAKEAGISKKDYLSRLGQWLTLKDEGKAAAAAFARAIEREALDEEARARARDRLKQ